MCSTITAGYFPSAAGRKYSQCTVLLTACGVTTGEGNVTSEMRIFVAAVSCPRSSKAKRCSARRKRSATLGSSFVGRNSISPRRTASSAKAIPLSALHSRGGRLGDVARQWVDRLSLRRAARGDRIDRGHAPHQRLLREGHREGHRAAPLITMGHDSRVVHVVGAAHLLHGLGHE